jgi:hypothetical protein
MIEYFVYHRKSSQLDSCALLGRQNWKNRCKLQGSTLLVASILFTL